MQVCVSVWEVEVKELEMSILVWSRGKYMNESEVALHLDPMPRLLSSLLFRLSVSAKYRSGKKGWRVSVMACRVEHSSVSGGPKSEL